MPPEKVSRPKSMATVVVVLASTPRRSSTPVETSVSVSSVRSGRTFVTSGAILRLTVNDQDPGSVIDAEPGQALKALRADVYVGTKVRVAPEDTGDIGQAITRSLDASLGRLARERVDLLQLHNSIGPARSGNALGTADVLDQVVPALQRLRQQGKIGFIGMTSNGETAALGRLKDAMHREFLWERASDSVPLFRLLSGDGRALAQRLSCDQEIAADGFFSLGMIADFDRSLREHGPSFYRHLFWESGVVGQVLYLEAEAAGARATGIGCFYDDPVHDVLGLEGHAFQSLYHFTVGVPIEDTRLTTEPGYSWERRPPEPANTYDV